MLSRSTLAIGAVLLAGLIWPALSRAQSGLPTLEPDTDPRAARFALVLENLTENPGADALLEAAATVLNAYPETNWFSLPRVEAELVRLYQAEVLAHLYVIPAGEDSQGEELYRVGLRFDAVPRTIPEDLNALLASPPQPLREESLVIALDRGGRYQREATWLSFVHALEDVIPAARPVATVTIRAEQPITIRGYPDWLAGEAEQPPSRQITLDLRTLRTYRFFVDVEGYRPEELVFYLEREPLEIKLDHYRYPRHTVAPTMRGLSWPGIEYGWYDSSTRWILHGGFTTFALGITPLRELSNLVLSEPDRDAQLFTSLPLTEFDLGFTYLFGDRDDPVRRSLTVAGLLRVTNVDSELSREPVMPTAIRLGLGREREFQRRFIISHRFFSDFFFPVEMGFLQEVPWSLRVGPVIWQLPIYRLAVRVIL